MPTANLPTASLGRYITFTEISRTSEVPVATIISWHRLAKAIGLTLGEKIQDVWHFSAHEFYQLSAAAALSRSGYPVSVDQLREVLEATAPPGRPEKSLLLTNPSSFAIIAIRTPALWDTTAHMLARAEANADV